MTITFCILAITSFALGIANGPTYTGDSGFYWIVGIVALAMALGAA